MILTTIQCIIMYIVDFPGITRAARHAVSIAFVPLSLKEFSGVESGRLGVPQDKVPDPSAGIVSTADDPPLGYLWRKGQSRELDDVLLGRVGQIRWKDTYMEREGERKSERERK